MIKQDRRWIYIFDLDISVESDDQINITMLEAAKKIEHLYKKKEAYRLSNNERLVTRISDYNINPKNNTVEVLIQLADADAADPVFSKLKTGELRKEEKKNDEGVAVSAHMIISTKPVRKHGTQYITLLEDVTGISRTLLKPFISKLFKQAFDNETYVDPDTKEKKKIIIRPELQGHADQKLEELLDGKPIEYFHVSNYEAVEEIDEDPHVKQVDSSIKLKLVKEPKDRIKFIQKLKDHWKKKGFKDFRIIYKAPSSTGQKVQRSLKLEKQQDAATALFTAQEEIVLSEPLSQCEPKLKKEVCDRMTKIMVATEQAISKKSK